MAHNGDIRSPIFYDSNNTARYMDPSGDSHAGDYYNIDGWFRNYGSNGLYNQDYQGHIFQPGNNFWHLNSKSGMTYGGLVLYSGYNSSHANATNRKGFLYWDPYGFGMLSSNGSWWLNDVGGNNNYLCIGGTNTQNAYNSNVGQKLMFGGADSGAQTDYYIGTNLENYGGNYSKLDLRWHTGIRMGAQQQYGGVRIFNSEDMGSILLSIGKGDSNTRVESGGFYAPIMYDLSNSSYYVDPASTSNLWSLETRRFRVETFSNASGTFSSNASLTDKDGRIIFPVTASTTTQTSNNGGGWANIGWQTTSRSGEQMHRNTSARYAYGGSGTAMGFYIEAGTGEAGGICLDEDSVNVYGSSDSGTTFRVIDKDSDVVTFEMLQSSWNGVFRGDVIAYGSLSSISDRRIKENIQPYENVLDKVMTLGVYSYNKITAPKDKRDKLEIGVIAQEVEEVFPELVNEEKVDKPEDANGLEKIKTVDYEHMTAILLQAVKELKAEIEDLKNGSAK